MNSIAPFFIVRNLRESMDFYVEKLGFEIQFIGPEGDEYIAIVGRDQIMLFLKEITPEVGPIPNPSRHPWAAWDAYIYAPDPDALAVEFGGRGLEVQVEVNSDNLRGFAVQDPNGFVIYIGRLN